MKVCTKCKTEKDESEFYTVQRKKHKQSGTYTYILPQCIKCFSVYYHENKEKHLLAVQNRRVRLRYGISLDEYNKLLSSPCAACGTTEVRRVMDHCHQSQKIRGALCDGCNLSLGGARDNPETLRNLADYVESHREVLSSNG